MKILKKISTEYSPIHALWNRNPVSLLTGGCKTAIIIISSEDISRGYTLHCTHSTNPRISRDRSTFKGLVKDDDDSCQYNRGSCQS